MQHGSKQEVKKLLIEEKITAILCNPNKQGYKIDKELLEYSSVKIINTCSTGLNHIDLTYCKNNHIKFSLTKDYDLIKNLPSTSELAFGLMLFS